MSCETPAELNKEEMFLYMKYIDYFEDYIQKYFIFLVHPSNAYLNKYMEKEVEVNHFFFCWDMFGFIEVRYLIKRVAELWRAGLCQASDDIQFPYIAFLGGVIQLAVL